MTADSAQQKTHNASALHCCFSLGQARNKTMLCEHMRHRHATDHHSIQAITCCMHTAQVVRPVMACALPFVRKHSCAQTCKLCLADMCASRSAQCIWLKQIIAAACTALLGGNCCHRACLSRPFIRPLLSWNCRVVCDRRRNRKSH